MLIVKTDRMVGDGKRKVVNEIKVDGIVGEIIGGKINVNV